jgi:glycopeptide antibiotics resistance protein
MQNYLTIILFAIYILILTSIILFKLPFRSDFSDGIRVINLIPFQGSYDEDGVIVWEEIRDNILIFIPFGIYICMLRSMWSLGRKTFAIIGLALAFEVIQFTFALGISDITDIIDNTLGGFIGIAIYTILFKIFKSRTNMIVNILALAVTICVVWRFCGLFYRSYFVMRRLPHK